MTERVKGKKSRSLLVAAIAVAAATAIACGANSYEIPIETPIQPELDVSPFQRILIAGFVAGGSEDVDANQETVRLLRSQLRMTSGLKVIDADVLSLMEIAQDQDKAAQASVSGGTPDSTGGHENISPPGDNPDSANIRGGNSQDHAANQRMPLPQQIKEEKDLQPYERLFANVAYWKQIGEEFQNPLIVTGTVLFASQSRSGFIQRDQEVYDQFGRRSVRPVRAFRERKGFVLQPKFVFIDGRTGTTMHSERYREEVLYSAEQNTPALSSYFELMDRLVPNFLSALSSQTIRGTRVLLK